MINATEARKQSLENRETLIRVRLKQSLNELDKLINTAISNGDTFIVVPTDKLCAGLAEEIRKVYKNLGYYTDIKGNNLGISWTESV